jgi:hypothetical protein
MAQGTIPLGALTLVRIGTRLELEGYGLLLYILEMSLMLLKEVVFLVVFTVLIAVVTLI